MQIELATLSDRDAWDGYVDAHPDATFFHRFAWRGVQAEALGYEPVYLMARVDGALQGVLPLACVRSRLFGTSVVSLPFCAYGGPIASSEQALAALDERAVALARELGAKFVEYRFVGDSPIAAPTQDLYQTWTRPVPANVEDLSAVPQKRRSLLRKALGHGLQVCVGREVDAFFDLYADNAHAHGTPALSRRFFLRLMEELGEAADILIVRDAAGRPLSGMLNFHFRDRLMAYFAGETAGARETYANDFKCWHLHRHALASGHAMLDYGRSKQGTGSTDFKKLWGFQPTPLRYAFRLIGLDAVPQNNPMNPKYRAAIGIWRRLPRGVVDWIGPRIIDGLG